MVSLAVAGGKGSSMESSIPQSFHRDAENMADKNTRRTCELSVNCVSAQGCIAPTRESDRRELLQVETAGYISPFTSCAHARLQICRAAMKSKVLLIDLPAAVSAAEFSPDFCPKLRVPAGKTDDPS